MSFLPYATSGAGSWFAATSGSVLTHGLVVAAALSGVQQLFDLSGPDLLPKPAYTVTLERLDSDTIVGLLEQQGEAGSDGADGTDTVLPESEGAVETETLAALTPEDVETPEPIAIEPASENELTPEEPEALAAVTPDALVAEAIEAITPEAMAPVEEDAGPLIAETVTASPVQEALSPLVSEGTASLLSNPAPAAPSVVQPVTSAQAVVAAVQPPTVTQPNRPALAQPARPSAPAPAPSAQDLAIGDLLRRIQSAVHETCLLALPRRDGEEGIGIALIGNSEAAMARFAEAVFTGEDAAIRQTRTLVDERQCAALSYVRENVDYPATRLGIRLDQAEVVSGGRLTGVLRGTAGRYVLLLLVDNNGVVQDLQRFMSFSGNFTRFDVPVTRDSAPRDTKQVLIAIASRQPLSRIRQKAGQLAQDVFAGLEGDIATQTALAVTTFDVR